MGTIRFSHEYCKMVNNEGKTPKTAIIMEVFKVKSEDLHPRFVEYNTMYLNEKDLYLHECELPKGDLILLLLKSDDKIWTTLRRYTPKKFEYYKNRRWTEDFLIKIEKPKS